ncbi:MAG: hypothetical protein A2Y75_03815 [Candidatus Solincola sediminis]|uniref:IPT/TIG domain-containing protein n=1 Tax=Candidatus Solincola sediminis TaxID=1797199 RepID=A0A1F2WHM1_9ACTN|nr:MAG: hypothetical protein A2Y75_03815 [Candidatus Solincola sediminis]
MTKKFLAALVIAFVSLLIASATGLVAQPAFVTAADSISPPASPARLIFIHHSTGENWLADGDGNLGISMRDNNYFVSDTNYGWGPDGIGDSTDIGNWWEWFRGPSGSTYLAALYAEDGQNSSYSRMGSSPGGENEVIMFKSCFPNSDLKGSPSDPVPAIGSNPLRGQSCGSAYHTVANAKGIYIDLLEYFRTRPDKLFIVIAAPPLQAGTHAGNARAFNNWLVDDWLDGYPYSNVFVFDFYNVLTSNGGSSSASDFNWESGNHHRWLGGAIQHKTDGGGNTLAYPTDPGNDHPNSVGNQKATGEFLPLLNVAYNRFKSGGAASPHIDSVSPASGAVGTEVTIEGSNFGSSRGSSHVSFESIQASQYNEWSDMRIRCLVPAGALSGNLKVTTGDGASNEVNFVVSLASVASRFYFAEGYTGDNFEEWLCLLNREDHSAIAQITYLFSDGSPPLTRDYPLAGSSRVTVNVNRAVGAGKEVSVKLESDGMVLAERPMYFNYNEIWDGGHDVMGAFEPSNRWYFAEGYTGEGFDEWICVLNPGSADAGLTFRFQTQEEGELLKDGYNVPANSRRTFKANDILGSNYQTSLAVESSQPVVVERPMYFDYLGRGNRHWEGGHCVMGATAASHRYYFAEGTTRSGFESWITLQNPGLDAITVNAVYQLGPGQGDPVEASYEVAPASRNTLFLAGEVGSNKDVSVYLSSSEDFLAERPMYFNYRYGSLNAQGGHCVIGGAGVSGEWLMAEGYTGGGFNQWLCLQNPGEDEAIVEIIYYTQEAGALPARSLVVPAKTRATVMVNNNAGADYQLSTVVRVISGPGIVVERPMYFNYGSGWDGGHDIVAMRTI